MFKKTFTYIFIIGLILGLLIGGTFTFIANADTKSVSNDVTVENDVGVLYISGDQTIDGSIRMFPDPNNRKLLQLEENTGGAWNLAGLQISGATINIGRTLSIESAGEYVSTFESVASTTSLIPRIIFTDDGTMQPSAPVLSEKQVRVIVQPDDSSSVYGTTLTAVFPSVTSGLRTAAYVRISTTTASAPVTITTRKDSFSGQIIWQQSYPASKFGPADTEIKVDFPGFIQADVGITLYTTLESDNPVSLKSNPGGIWWVALDFFNLSENNMLSVPQWTSGATTTLGDWTIEDNLIYVANTTEIQSGIFASSTDKWDTLTAGFSHVGDDINYVGGNVGIGTTTPTTALYVNGTGTFSNIINSGLTASLGVYTDSSSQLTSTAPTSGVLGYWDRTGTVLSPSNAGDDISTTGDLFGADATFTGDTGLNIISTNTANADNFIKLSGKTSQNQWMRYRYGGGSPNGKSGIIFSDFDTDNYFINADSDGDLHFRYSADLVDANATDLMILNSSGNFGIGTSPTNPLHIKSSLDANTNPASRTNYALHIAEPGGTATGKGQGIVFTNANSVSASIISTDRGSSNRTALDFYVDGGATYDRAMRLDYTGIIYAYGDLNIAEDLDVTGTSTFNGIIDNELTASLGVYTNGSKQLTSTPPTSGILGYWDRTGTTISTATAGDDLTITGDLTVPNIAGGIVFNEVGADVDFRVESDTIASAFTIDGSTGVVETDGHEVATIDDNRFEIWSTDDLPAPIGGIITLQTGMYYFMTDITISDNIELAAGASVQWIMPNGYENAMTFDGTGTFISSALGGTNSFRILFPGITIYLTEDDVTLFDIDGSLGVAWAFFGFQGDGGTIGTLDGSPTGILTSQRFFWLNSSVSGWTNGLTITNSDRLIVDTGTITSHASSTDSFLTLDNIQAFVNISKTVFNLSNASTSAFNIRPINTNDIGISRIDLGDSLGSFFAASTTGAFTSITDLSHIESIGLVEDFFTLADFDTVTDHDYVEGDIITHTGFSEETYNTVDGEVHITDSHRYRLWATPGVPDTIISYVSDDSGTGTLEKIRLTSVAHGLSVGDQINITDTISYNGGFEIFATTTDTFDIFAPFVATETGTWDTGSLTESSKYVTTASNGPQKDSSSVASGYVNGNAEPIGTIVNNTFTDMVFGATSANAMIVGSNTERFTLIDPINGTYRYDGLNPFDGVITTALTGKSAGGAQEFRFKWVHDVGAGFVDLPDIVEGMNEIAGTAGNTTFTTPLRTEPGGILKPVLTRTAGVSGLTVSYFNFTLR
jgi:hypothetical protein